MKYSIGPGLRGKPIPRIANPIVTLGLAVVLAMVAMALAMGAVFCLVALPFSWLTTFRIREEK